MNSYEFWRRLLAGLLLTGASLFPLSACRSGDALSQDANRLAVAEWKKNMEILERGLAGGPLRGTEFESACLFFERLTSIPVRGNGTPVGYLPTDETREDFERLKQWFTQNRELLFFDERSNRIEVRAKSSSKKQE